MNEKEILLSHSRDLKMRSSENSMITSTAFLTPEERSTLAQIERENNKYVNTFYFGGYEDAERTVAIFVPIFFEFEDVGSFFSENPDENPLALIRLTKDRFTKMTHRDYLGALMSLGIKRELMGDIIVDEGGAYVFVLKSIGEYICENLKKAARGSVKCEVIPFSELCLSEDNGKVEFASVSSLRLDSVIAAAFNLSRKSASEYITKGLVYVGGVQNFKSDFSLKEKDKLVIRGKGKSVINKIIGETKKGRIHLEIKRYK